MNPRIVQLDPVHVPNLTISGTDYLGTHIQFIQHSLDPKKKTKAWAVENKHGDGFLGHVKWFGRWRKYSFFPAEGCVFEEVCMREISGFIVDRTKDHREAVKKCTKS